MHHFKNNRVRYVALELTPILLPKELVSRLSDPSSAADGRRPLNFNQTCNVRVAWVESQSVKGKLASVHRVSYDSLKHKTELECFPIANSLWTTEEGKEDTRGIELRSVAAKVLERSNIVSYKNAEASTEHCIILTTTITERTTASKKSILCLQK